MARLFSRRSGRRLAGPNRRRIWVETLEPRDVPVWLPAYGWADGQTVLPAGTTYDPVGYARDGYIYQDVRQRNAGTCVFDSALAAAAARGLNLGAKIQYLGNYQYRVEIERLGSQTITFDGRVYQADAYPTVVDGHIVSFWPLLFQRAYLQAYGVNYRQDAIDPPDDAKKPRFAIFALTNGVKDNYDADDPGDQPLAHLVQFLQDNRIITVETRARSDNYFASDDNDQIDVDKMHQYAVLGLDTSSSPVRVHMANPWGLTSNDSYYKWWRGDFWCNWSTFTTYFETFTGVIPLAADLPASGGSRLASFESNSQADQQAPSLAGGPGGNITVVADRPAGALVTYAPFVAADNYDTAPIITYDHPSGSTFAVGNTLVTVRARDVAGNEDSTTFTVSVLANPPVGAADSYHVNSRPFFIAASNGLLANDIDAVGLPLAAKLEQSPAHGTLTLNADGSFAYAVSPGYVGDDSFSYRPIDSASAGNAIPVNLHIDQPPSVNNDRYKVFTDNSLSIDAAAGVLANDASAYGNPIVAEQLSSPTHGTLTFNSDGSFNYLPDAGYAGVDSFTYRTGDVSLWSDTVSVAIRVGHPPVAQLDAYTVPTDQSTFFGNDAGPLANDSNPDGFALSSLLVTSPAHGWVALGAAGNFYYTPDPGYEGPDSFAYQASDGDFTSAPATVSIAVEKPPEANADAYFAFTSETTTVSAADGVLANDVDHYGRTLHARLIDGPYDGGLTLNDDGSFTYTPGADAARHFTSVSFKYVVSNGVLESAPVSSHFELWSITANSEFIPGLTSAEYAIEPDATYQSTDSLFWNDWVSGSGPITNIYQAKAELVTGPAHGTLSLQDNGQFAYTPDAGFHGRDPFTYRVGYDSHYSNTATATMIVAPRPGTDDNYTVAVGATLTVPANQGVMANDSAGTGPAIRAVLEQPPDKGTLNLNVDGSFVWTPPPGPFDGKVQFTYLVDDGSARAKSPTTVTITVGQSPAANDDFFPFRIDQPQDSYELLVMKNDSPGSGSILGWVPEVVTQPTHGTVVAAVGNYGWEIDYTPTPGFEGVDQFTYRDLVNHTDFSDEYTAPASVTVQIKPRTQVGADSYQVSAGGILDVPAALGVLGNDVDAWGDPLQASLLPAYVGTLVGNPDGSFRYQAPNNFAGTVYLTYDVGDGVGGYGGYDNSANVLITVGDPPIGTPDSYRLIGTGNLVVSADNGLLVNDRGLNGTQIRAELVDGPAHGFADVQADGSFVYQPFTDFVHGVDSFTYRIIDGEFTSDPVAVTIHLDQPPIGTYDYYSLVGPGAVSIPADHGVLVNDTGFDPLAAELVSGPAHGSITLNADGSFTFVPEAGYHGTDRFLYRLLDGDLPGEPVPVDLQIDFPPTATDDAFDVEPNFNRDAFQAPTSALLANDTGYGNLRIELVDYPQHGSLSLDDDFTHLFTYTPNIFTGIDTFTYRVIQGDLVSSLATVRLNVHHDAPTGLPDEFTINDPTGIPAYPVSNVLDNDGVHYAYGWLHAELVNGPSHGQLTFGADGSVAYVPNFGFSGVDTFSYRPIQEELPGEPTTVTINVALSWANLLTGDVNGDGKPDRIGRLAGLNTWWVALGGQSQAPRAWYGWNFMNLDLTNINQIFIGDLNGDKRADLLGRDPVSGIWYAGLSMGDQSQSFMTVVWARWSPKVTWTDVAVGDFNGDGKMDLIGRNARNGKWWLGVSIVNGFLTRGNWSSHGKWIHAYNWGTWSPKHVWTQFAVRDLNGDGRDDIVARDEKSGIWQVTFAMSKNRFQQHSYATDLSLDDLAVALGSRQP
jgi:hypothetical protein